MHKRVITQFEDKERDASNKKRRNRNGRKVRVKKGIHENLGAKTSKKYHFHVYGKEKERRISWKTKKNFRERVVIECGRNQFTKKQNIQKWE